MKLIAAPGVAALGLWLACYCMCTVDAMPSSSPMQTGLAPAVCTDEHAEAQADKFFEVYRPPKAVRWSACGKKQWLNLYHELAPSGVRRIMDIGGNKGYEAALFIDLMTPEVGLEPETIHNLHIAGANFTGNMCGACGSCHDKVDRGQTDSSKHHELHLYTFEPSIRNFYALLSVEAQFHAALTQRNVTWRLYNAAASNTTGMVSFPRDCANSLCSMYKRVGRSSMDMTFTGTIDEFVRLKGIPRIDVLKIDTEGHDPAVLSGTRDVIQGQKVEVVYFEYHSVGLWKTTSLKSVVSWLSDYGYACYFDGDTTLTRLTGCWSERYEFHSWSRVVCTYKKSFMYRPMEMMSFLFTDVLSLTAT